jgi:hypothetical protein
MLGPLGTGQCEASQRGTSTRVAFRLHRRRGPTAHATACRPFNRRAIATSARSGIERIEDVAMRCRGAPIPAVASEMLRLDHVLPMFECRA